VKTTQQLELFGVPINSYQQRMDAALIHSLHSFTEADQRWVSHREKGLNDDHLRQAIAVEFGIYGGASRPETHCYQGGSDPKFWLASISPHGKPTLKGQPLLERVRSLLAIPYPLMRGLTQCSPIIQIAV
jgi:hypothetical protein